MSQTERACDEVYEVNFILNLMESHRRVFSSVVRRSDLHLKKKKQCGCGVTAGLGQGMESGSKFNLDTYRIWNRVKLWR